MMAGNSATVADGAITSAKIASGAVGGAQLASGAAAANLALQSQAAVPSSGMILSSNAANANLLAAGYVKLGEVILGDGWDQRGTTGAPAARIYHTAVWTGTEMIVWGGLMAAF